MLGFAVALLAAGGAGAQSPAGGAGASARAYAISVIVPGLPNSSTPVVSSPPQSQVASGGAGFTFNAPDGTPVVTTGSYVATVNADATANPLATATAEVTDLTLFGGEVTVSDVVVRARASAKPGNATGDLSGGGVSGLVVGGQPQTAAGRVPLADWGYAQVMVQTGAPAGSPPSFHGFVTGLDIRLTADHGGLPAGTEIQVGYAEATAQAPAGKPTAPPATTPIPKPRKPAPAKPSAQPKAKEPKTTPGVPPSLLPSGLPPKIAPNLTAGPYVFPVYGPSSFTDTFGAPRGDVSGGWHHGDDIFAPLGAPILAVARGTVFSVGWNNVGGNRLWLRDGQGNQYYYAHLSAYTPAAVNNAHVRAGTVLGFVGNTGDAEGTPYHLHFEIHPVALLGMGYDGVLDPTSILERWQHVQDVRFAAAAGWAPIAAGSASAPQAGAILLQASDISNATGLEPGAVEKAASPLVEEGAAGLLGIQQRPPRGPVYETR